MDIPRLASAAECIGCTACASRCPKNAIYMQRASDGFLRSKTDAEQCIQCGACTKACPVLQQNNNANISSPSCYTGWVTDDEKRLASSSGGAFTALAEQVLTQGGCVFGVALLENLTAAHICVESADELSKLRGSKYIPSSLGTAFRDAEKQLKTGRRVLFSGTPCEIAGLLSYLRKNYDNLLTCDLSCHGTPSQKLFEKYIAYINSKTGSSVVHVQFRNKETGWLNFSLKSNTAGNGASLSIPVWQDPFMQGFLSNAALKPACYGCRWHEPHQADITLADAWGIHQLRPEWDHTKGVSLMLAHTEKGKAALRHATDCGTLFLQKENEEDAAMLIQANEGLVHRPIPIPNRRKRFLQDLESDLPLTSVLDKHLTSAHPRKLRKDVGIIGLWMTCNYGAVLTDFALYRLLQAMGYDPILLDHSLASGRIPQFMDPATPFRRFLKEQQIETSQPLDTGADMDALNDSIDTFMVGSDQMWHIALWEKPELRPLIEYYLLNFVRPDKKKIAFASSFGTDKVSASTKTRKWEMALLRLFDSVSVREDSGAHILKQYYGVQAPVVLDPVFLCDRNLFDEVAAGSKLDENDYICSYVLDNRPEFRELENQLSQKTGCRIKHLTNPDAQNNGDFILHNLNDNMGIPEWIYYISHCRYLITDSYHGVCFAIIYNKPFTAIGNAKRGLTRFESLLRLLKLSHRLQLPGHIRDLDEDVDWNAVNLILAEQKALALHVLEKALHSPRTKHIRHLNEQAWKARRLFKLVTKGIMCGRWINAAMRGTCHALLAGLHINAKRHQELRAHHGSKRREIARQIAA